MNPSAPSLSVISAIVTPAILILACSSLITATAGRLSRVLERARELTREAEALTEGGKTAEPGKRDFVVSQLRKAATRAKFLQRALAQIYLSLGTLVLTSVSAGIGTAMHRSTLIVINLAVLTAVGILLYACALLIRESRLAVRSVNAEMDYVLRLTGKISEPAS
ncbi:MAG TPA: DUF2721 domain-containing protein [Candidatus Eisenbacteria bacterium]|nr:DUF2721 domain-containing protein [Candidatus Eisenbacteria bacterium]